MQSPFCFIVKPYNDRRYDNIKYYGDKKFFTSTSEEDHTVSTRFAIVINTPINYNGRSIIIAQINANSIGNKKNEIENLLKEKNITILCINDTRLVRSKKIRFIGYKLLRKDHATRRSRAGGVAIAIKNGIKAFEHFY